MITWLEQASYHWSKPRFDPQNASVSLANGSTLENIDIRKRELDSVQL